MVTGEVIQRVFRCRYGQWTGSAFTTDVAGKQYLITAKHIVEGATEAFVLEIFHDGMWKTLPVKLVGHAEHADLSVLAAGDCLTGRDMAVAPDSNGLAYSQDVYFLGFPHDLFGELGPVNNGYPVPFVKKAIVSMLDSESQPIIILDGINNEGFSGGPAVFQPPGSRTWQIAGVVSSYLAMPEAVYSREGETELHHLANTGLIYVAPIGHAVRVIEANPIGCPHP